MNTSPLRLTAAFKDTLSLAQAWMPFIRNGALFVPTASRPSLGDPVFVLINLEFLGQRHAITGTVVWVSAQTPESGAAAGIGVAFPDDETGRKLVSQITDSIGNMQASLKKTATL